MEKQLKQKIDKHMLKFKDGIKEWLTENNASVNSAGAGGANVNITSAFLQYIYDSTGMTLNEDDFKKRKRIKNSVPQFDLCIAKRANGEQCTRRKKGQEGDGAEPDNNFCGTHVKGTPHGTVSAELEKKPHNKKVEVWVQDIKGINYYIDAANNVYKPEDIIANKIKPAVIATWAKNAAGGYTIPQFGI